MNNDAIKSANRKALPKFILLTLISTAMNWSTNQITHTAKDGRNPVLNISAHTANIIASTAQAVLAAA